MDRYRGTFLKDGHSIQRFESLLAGRAYLDPPHHFSPVIVEPDQGAFRIVDGLHRACVERFRGAKKLIAAVVS
jgi:hypothetical protein